MRGRVAIAAVVLVGTTGAFAWWTLRSRQPASSPDTAVPAAFTSAEVPPPCDPIPTPPPLPATLAPSAQTVDAIVQALDASLGPAHKDFLRCFPDEDALVARVHFGFGRWLRSVLHLRQAGGEIAELRELGVKEPDDISAVIVRVYARFLRQAPLDLPDAVARTRKMADVPGVAQ